MREYSINQVLSTSLHLTDLSLRQIGLSVTTSYVNIIYVDHNENSLFMREQRREIISLACDISEKNLHYVGEILFCKTSETSGITPDLLIIIPWILPGLILTVKKGNFQR